MLQSAWKAVVLALLVDGIAATIASAAPFEMDEVETDVAHRAARLYKFDRRKYRRLTKQGFHFEI